MPPVDDVRVINSKNPQPEQVARKGNIFKGFQLPLINS